MFIDRSNTIATTPLQVKCSHHTFIFRNDSLEQKYPGGLDGFRKHHVSGSNDAITVYCDSCNALGTILKLVAIGLELSDDFVAIDTEACKMLQVISSKEIERPFWFETGADWLKYKYSEGKVLVWYDEQSKMAGRSPA